MVRSSAGVAKGDPQEKLVPAVAKSKQPALLCIPLCRHSHLKIQYSYMTKNRSPIKHRIFATRPSLCSPLKCMFQSGGFTARAADRRGPSTSQLRARGRTSILPPSWQCLKSAPFCTLAATVSLGSVACEPPKTSTEYIILSEQCLRVDLFKMIRELWSARPKMCRF